MAVAVPIYQAKNRLPLFIHQVEQAGPIRLSRHNKEVAVIISISDYDALVAQAAKQCSILDRAAAFRKRTAALFTNQDIDDIFAAAKDDAAHGTSWEDGIFDGVLEGL